MQRWKKHIWTGALLTASVLLILAAVVVGSVRLIDLAAPKYRERLASKMSETLDLPVTIGGIGMSWQAFRPTFELDEVIVLDQERRPAFQVTHIGLPFRWSSLLQGELFPYMIELRGLAIALEWRADGSVGIRGVGEAAQGGELDVAEIFAYLDRINRIEINESVVNWSDFGAPIGLTRVEQVNASLEKAGKGIRMLLDGRLPQHLGEDFHFDADIEGTLASPEELQITMRFRTESLYADGWLGPLLRDTVALRGGPMRVEFSSEWQGLTFQQAALRLAVNPLRNVGTVPEQELPGVNAELKILPLGDGWDMNVQSLQYWREDGKSPVARGHFRYQPTPDGFGTRLDADLDSLRVPDFFAWLSVLEASSGIPLQPAGATAGRIQGARFEYYHPPGGTPQYEMMAQIEGLKLAASGDLPGISGLAGKFYATENAGRFDASASGGSLEIPKVFKQGMPLQTFKAGIEWERQGEHWRVFSDSLTLDALTAEVQGGFTLLLDDQPSPEIDLRLAFEASDVKPLKPYIPLPPALPEKVGEWLQASIVAGEVPRGTMQLTGRLSDFPFENPGEKGVFRIEFDALDARLAYAPDWPEVEKIRGHAVFKGRSMHIQAESGRILDVPIGRTTAAIPDFLNPELIVKGAVQSDAGRQFAFLGASPLKADYQGLLDAISLQGPGHLDLELRLPLDNVEAVSIAGDIELQSVQLKYSGLETPIENIRGRLRFSEKGLSADALSGLFMGLPTEARLTPVTVNNRQMTHLQASTTLRLPEDAPKLAEYLSAQTLQACQGQAVITLESSFDSSASASELTLQSNLQGLAIDLGKPFAKKAEESREVQAVIVPETTHTDLRWRYSDQMQGLLRFVSEAGQYRLQLGKIQLGEAAALAWPLQPGLYVEGKLPVLDLNAVGGGTGTGGALPPVHVNAEFGVLRVAGQEFRNIHLRSGEIGQWLSPLQGMLVVDGDNASGQLGWQHGADGRMRVDGEFERLDLNMPPDWAEQAQPEPAQTPAGEPLDPLALPLLTLNVKNFRLSNEGLGSLKLRTEPLANGIRLSTLEIGGRRISVRGGGEWLRANGQSRAQLSMNIKGNDIAGLLNATGYARSITAEKADVFAELDWAPAASGLEMENLNGKMSFDLVDGSLLEVKPGAGRILSLLSFYSLPRRLSLDFSDVLGKGTAFDKLTGVFAIENGNATTDDLVVITPSARIEVRGRVGLAAQDYDQVVTIYPGVASGVALAGAVLGGPVLGIGLWLAQELLDKPLEQATRLSYRLTGNWDDPKIEPLGAEARKSPPATENKPVSKPPPAPVEEEADSGEGNEATTP